MVLYKVTVFRSSRIFNMAAKANNMLWLAEISKIFFSETNELTEPKLYMNDHWNVLYQVTVFYAHRKSKMATTAGHRLTLDPMGKYSNAFFSDTTSMIKAKLYMNVHWMVLYNLKGFCSDMKFQMAANCTWMFIRWIIGRSSTNFLFFMPIGNPRWPPPQYID